MIKLGEVVMILDLHRQGLSVSAIARELGIDRKTVRRYIARGLEPPVYGPRKPRQRLIDPFVPYLRERVDGLSGPDRPSAVAGAARARLRRRLHRRHGFAARSAAVPIARLFEVRFETPPGDQAQVDFAQFQVVFTDEPTVTRIVWLFSFVLGYSRLIWARFVLHQDMQTVLRCHMAAFEAIGGVPREILYDRMKTAVIGETGRQHRLQPRAHRLCPALRLPTQGLPPLPGQNQGQGRAALSLYPRGLLPRPLVPQSRRSECSVTALDRYGRQSAGTRHHTARGQ